MKLGLCARLAISLALALALALILHISLLPAIRSEAVSRSQPEALEASVPLPHNIPSGRTGRLFLLAPGEEPWEGLAPLVEIPASGTIRLLRGPLLPLRPMDGDLWAQSGVILPTAELSGLNPGQRATLLNLLSQWSGGGGLSPRQCEGRGIRFHPGELRGLLQWLR